MQYFLIFMSLRSGLLTQIIIGYNYIHIGTHEKVLGITTKLYQIFTN